MRKVLDQTEQGRRFVGDRYQVSIPWKEGQPLLPDNRNEAVKRLIALEKSLHRRGSDIRSRHMEPMQENFKKGYFQPVQNPSPGGWYLPHFAIIREEKATTKLRIVFDTASNFTGKSLNDAMHTAPKLQNDIVSVLFRFRSNPVAIVGRCKGNVFADRD